jgi:hypothetical protein
MDYLNPKRDIMIDYEKAFYQGEETKNNNLFYPQNNVIPQNNYWS